MRSPILAVLVLMFSPNLFAVVIGNDALRKTAKELVPLMNSDKCPGRSPEIRLAAACYTGAMDVNTSIKFVGTIDDRKLSYCYNALVLPLKSGRPKLQVLRDNGSGQTRAQNFVVPEKAKDNAGLELVGVDGMCVTKEVGYCAGDKPLSLNYDTDKGWNAASSVAFVAKTTRLNVDSTDFEQPKVAADLVSDIDRRLELAKDALISESQSPVAKEGPRGKLLKDKASAILNCVEQSNRYRGENKIAKTDADADAQRRALIDAVKRIEAGQPAEAGGGAGAGSSR